MGDLKPRDRSSDPPIMPGAEPFAFEGGAVGVLVCHGFTGTPQSMRPLGEALHRAGCSVLCPLLPGHGTSVEAMAASTARQWTATVERSFAELRSRSDRIFVAGLSMGGALALYLAGRHPDAVAGVIAINAVVELEGAERASLVFDPEAPPAVPGIGSDIKDGSARELAYASVPVPALAELFALVGVTRALLPRITCPALVVTSREDHVVPPANEGFIRARIGSARIEQLRLENSYHVATLDHDRALIGDASIRFIRSIL